MSIGMLDLQLMSVGMLDLFELLGRARRNSGILPGTSSTRLFELLGERHGSADNLCGTNADSQGTNVGGTFHIIERGPRNTTTKLAQHASRDQYAEASRRKSTGEQYSSSRNSPSHKWRTRQGQPVLRAEERGLHIFRGAATLQPEGSHCPTRRFGTCSHGRL